MDAKLITLLTIVGLSFIVTHAAEDNKNDNLKNNMNEYADMASTILGNQNADNLGGIISNFVQSDQGKQIGDMLMGMGENNNANQLLQGLSSLMGQGAGAGGSGGGFDPSILGTVMSALSDSNQGTDGGQNPLELLSMFGGMLGGTQDGGANLMALLPSLLNTFSSVNNNNVQEKVDKIDHSGHAWFLPPILEKFHVAFDQFLNSELGKSLMQALGTEKFVKVFSDSNGKFNIDKVAEMLENHSFRKHWIELVTRKVSGLVSYFTDPGTQKRFLTTIQYFLNTFLKTQGFPKSTLFDPSRPTETITNFVNYSAKKYFNMKINSKSYVKPAVQYIKDIVKLAQHKGILNTRAIDSSELSHKLADTINLEVIEPVARVYRAYRFAKKVPKCDRYVMCLINENRQNEAQSLPGLKVVLSKGSSLFASWFLSSHTGTSFWSLYSAIIDEDNCKVRYIEACNDFHVEELKVTTEYSHNEL